MENKSQKNTITGLYILLIVSIVTGFIPNITAFAASAVLWLVTLAAAYIYRAKDKDDGLLYNHMTYMIGTIWIGTTLLVTGALIAAWWIFTKGDNTAIDGAVASIQNGGIPDTTAQKAIIESYIITNRELLWTASAVTLAPAILYFAYRIGNALARAAGGYRIANPKSWL